MSFLNQLRSSISEAVRPKSFLSPSVSRSRDLSGFAAEQGSTGTLGLSSYCEAAKIGIFPDTYSYSIFPSSWDASKFIHDVSS
jgi:hypothetical protein